MTIGFYNPSEHYAFINLFYLMVARHTDRVFARYQTADSKFNTLTYEEVDRITTNLACRWSLILGTTKTAGLIADHSIDYLLVMLAFLKLRVELLVLSPRNSEAANVNLIEKTACKFIFATHKYEPMAKGCATQLLGIGYHIFELFDLDAATKEPLQSNITSILNKQFGEQDEDKTAIIMHSSGTTGLPKPIRLSNRYLICNVQYSRYDLNYQPTAISLRIDDIFMGSVPLFHVFGLHLYLSPMMVGASSLYFTRLPPSPREIIDAVEDQGVTVAGMVPLTITQLAAYLKKTGRYLPLQKLRHIQYAGAGLEHSIGEFFHDHNINVRNVYGSTEGGPLAASDYSDRKYWYALKPLPLVEVHIEWEVVDQDLKIYHPVIKAGAPFMATGASNRPNGDFATNDLFMEEPGFPGYYRLLGRKDDMLVMENGEKINPTPMENIIASSGIVRHCTIIGQDRVCPSVLVELDLEQAIQRRPEEMISLVHEAVQKANIEAPNHSTILPEMVYILHLDKHLPTTDKGSVSRNKAIEIFSDAVEKLYADFLNGHQRPSLVVKNSAAAAAAANAAAGWSLERIEAYISQAAAKVLQRDDAMLLSCKDQSLFDYGLNSLLSIQLRNQIAEKFGNVASNFVFEHPSIASMTRALGSTSVAQTDVLEKRCQETQALLDSYIARANKDFSTVKTQRCQSASNMRQQQEVVLLTGATGSLGTFMLRDMLLSPKVRKVCCLVRGKRGDQLMARIRKSFSDRRLNASLLDTHASKLVVFPMDLNADYLGLSKEEYDHLKSEVTIVQACAWLVDFNLSVSHFEKECIQGLYKLLLFAHRPIDPMHVHCISSISATARMETALVPETSSPRDPHVAMPMGYAHSKYIVEHLFDYLTKEKKFPCIVERMGQVCGDSEHGVWNPSEQYPLIMIGGGAMLGKVPDLETNTIDWLPVDFAAASIVDIMLKTADTHADDLAGKVFHIVNPKTITWADVLKTMKTCGFQFDVVSPEEWVKALSGLQDNPAYRLIPFFEANYINTGSNTARMTLWDTTNTIKTTSLLNEAPTFDANLMQKHLDHWEFLGFYQP